MPRRHRHPRSRRSFLGVVAGIALVAASIACVVPAVLGWPAAWPAAALALALAGGGIALVTRHFFRYPAGRDRAPAPPERAGPTA